MCAGQDRCGDIDVDSHAADLDTALYAGERIGCCGGCESRIAGWGTIGCTCGGPTPLGALMRLT